MDRGCKPGLHRGRGPGLERTGTSLAHPTERTGARRAAKRLRRQEGRRWGNQKTGSHDRAKKLRLAEERKAAKEAKAAKKKAEARGRGASR